MDFFELIHSRRSVRAFQSHRPIEDHDVSRLLEAASRACSAGNLQAYRVVVVREGSIRDRLAEAAHRQHFVATAPLILVFIADTARAEARYRDKGPLFAIEDATSAASYAQLAAQALGLGSVWIGSFEEREIRETLHVPERFVPVCLLAVGHPAEQPEPTPRRPLHEIARRETFDGRGF